MNTSGVGHRLSVVLKVRGLCEAPKRLQAEMSALQTRITAQSGRRSGPGHAPLFEHHHAFGEAADLARVLVAAMPRVTFVEVDGGQREVEVAAGATVLEAAKANDLPVAGTCGGSMVCATCHVMIGAGDRTKLLPPSEDEEDTLDLAFGVTADSRLGCQIRLTDAMDGIRIRLTSTMHTV